MTRRRLISERNVPNIRFLWQCSAYSMINNTYTAWHYLSRYIGKTRLINSIHANNLRVRLTPCTEANNIRNSGFIEHFKMRTHGTPTYMAIIKIQGACC